MFFAVELQAVNSLYFELIDLCFYMVYRTLIAESMLALLHLDELSLDDLFPAYKALLT